MYEHRTQALLPRRQFLHRVARHALVAVGLLLTSLGVGVLGYRWTEDLPWLDALVNASMILGGMGPVGELKTPAGKLFASGYALFSGVVFLVFASILLAPVAHRFLHRFHLDLDERGDGKHRRPLSERRDGLEEPSD
jgi:hypothetical protein